MLNTSYLGIARAIYRRVVPTSRPGRFSSGLQLDQLSRA